MGYCKPFKRGASWRSQNFGDRATVYGPHTGNDEAAPVGTPVHAAGDGVIEYAGEFDSTYADNLLWLIDYGGKCLVLNCGDGAPSFVYAHLSVFHVKPGQRVSKGQIIAESGNTGKATTGAHLHMEAIPPGYTLSGPLLGRVDPDIYLTEWPEDLTPQKDDYVPITEKEFDRIFSSINSAATTVINDNRAQLKAVAKLLNPDIDEVALADALLAKGEITITKASE